MHKALRAFQVDPNDDDPTWLAFFTMAELTALQASVSSYLGKPARAAAQLRTSLDTLSPDFTRNRALYVGRLALAHLADGDERQACDVLGADLPLFTTVRSGRAMAHLDESLAVVSKSRAPYARDLVARAQSAELVGAV
jgi:ATP/maltotriose-dependent transcriptional regulator MalT